ncbi:hypothetical protein IJG72_06785, partial [bacterium]|nr:hypothetical protein [bacterium]
LNEAHNRATAVYGPVETWFVNDNDWEQRTKRYFDRLTEFLKTTKICRDSNNGCMTENEDSGTCVHLRAGYCDGDYADYPQAILSSGTSIAMGDMGIYNKTCNGTYSSDTDKIKCGGMYVDIDGPNKGKYNFGTDVFTFDITKDGILPSYTASYCSKNNNIFACIDEESRYGFITWVLEKGNMDYLKTDSNLKCPDETQLTWEKGSCK